MVVKKCCGICNFPNLKEACLKKSETECDYGVHADTVDNNSSGGRKRHKDKDDSDPVDNGGDGLLNVFGPKINGDDPFFFVDKPIYDGQAC
jgi:hypothetical protein